VGEARASLALALQTRGWVLERGGRLDEAVADLRAAVGLHQELAAERPELFKPLLDRNRKDVERILERLKQPSRTVSLAP